MKKTHQNPPPLVHDVHVPRDLVDENVIEVVLSVSFQDNKWHYALNERDAVFCFGLFCFSCS